MMRAPALAALLSCVPAPVVHAPITVLVEPPTLTPCTESERILVDDALQSIAADAGED